jgi:hypothetical protein
MKKHITIFGLLIILLFFAISGCLYKTNVPKIEFIQENGWLIVSYVEKSNLTWNNINISISSGNYSDIGFHYSSEISSLIGYGNGSSCPLNWGFIAIDNGIFFKIVNSKVTLKWIPENVIIGKWNFK